MITSETTFSFLQGGGEMGELTRNFDWSKTPLGTPGQWSLSLRTAVSILLHSQFPMFVWWGQELTTIYNDSYTMIAGDKHPALLGKSGREAWAEVWNDLAPLVDKVFQGESTWAEDLLLHVYRRGFGEDAYFTFSYSPIIDEAGAVSGLFCAVVETTDKVMSKKKLEESKDSLAFAVEAAELATWDYNPITNQFTADGRYTEWFGLSAERPSDNNPSLNIIAEEDRGRVTEALTRALNFSSGGRYEIEYTIRPKDKPERILRAKGKAYFNADGVAYRLTGTLQDVTVHLAARKKIEESEARFRTIVEQAPLPIALTRGPEMVFESINEPMLKMIDRTNVIGKPLAEVLPELKEQLVEGILQKIIDSAETFRGFEVPATLRVGGQLQPSFYNILYSPVVENGVVTRIIHVAIDVSEQVLARKKVEEKSAELELALEVAELGNFQVDLIRNRATYSQRIIDWFGVTEQDHSLDFLLESIHPDDRSRCLDAIRTASQPGSDGRIDLNFRIVHPGGTVRYLRAFNKIVFNEEGEAWLMVGAIQDTTPQMIYQQRIEESESRFRNMVKQASVAIMLTRGTDVVIESINRPMLNVLGKKDEGEVLGKKLLEVVPELRGQPGYDIAKQVTARGEAFTANEVPISVMIDGVLTERFFDLSYTALKDENQETGVLHVAMDVTQQAISRRKLEESEAELQRRVDERTQQLAAANKELQRSNDHLEEFAHAASHDLKEPIRKIQIFTDRLRRQLSDKLTPEDLKIFGSVEQAGKRMNALITDLLLYSHVSEKPHEKETIDLNENMKQLLEDLDLDIEEKGAVITVGKLPLVKGYRRQLQQLFHNLLTNALKYSRLGVSPEITISGTLADGNEAGLDGGKKYDLITVSDNGIGFRQEQTEKIFQMFQRLHAKHEYEGTGVGLSIARKVAENHGGKITAESRPGNGATFYLYLPVE